MRMRVERDAFRPFISVGNVETAHRNLQISRNQRTRLSRQTERQKRIRLVGATRSRLHGFDACAFNDIIPQDAEPASEANR